MQQPPYLSTLTAYPTPTLGFSSKWAQKTKNRLSKSPGSVVGSFLCRVKKFKGLQQLRRGLLWHKAYILKSGLMYGTSWDRSRFKKKFHFDTIANITRENNTYRDQLYLWVHRHVCCDEIEYHQLVSKVISVNGKSRFDQSATFCIWSSLYLSLNRTSRKSDLFLWLFPNISFHCELVYYKWTRFRSLLIQIG